MCAKRPSCPFLPLLVFPLPLLELSPTSEIRLAGYPPSVGLHPIADKGASLNIVLSRICCNYGLLSR